MLLKLSYIIYIFMSSEEAVVLNLGKITELREKQLKVEILHDL